jgi:hypothetical protein
LENQSDWAPLLGKLLNKDKYADLFVTNWAPDITVADMRGKILLMSRFKLRGITYNGKNYPTVYCTWTDEDADINENIDVTAQKGCGIFKITNLTVPDTPDATLYVQDYYKSNSEKRMANKKQTLIDMMNLARTECASTNNTWIINHCSAYTEVSPRGYLTNAANLHPLVIENLLKNKGTVGIMPIDMACHDYIHCIINGGTPYTSDYLYGFYPMSQSLTNLLIKSNEQYFK